MFEGSSNVTVSDSFLLNGARPFRVRTADRLLTAPPGDNMIDLGFSWTAVSNIRVQRCTFSNLRSAS